MGYKAGGQWQAGISGGGRGGGWVYQAGGVAAGGWVGMGALSQGQEPKKIILQILLRRNRRSTADSQVKRWEIRCKYSTVYIM